MPTLILSPRRTADGHRLRWAAALSGWRTEWLTSWHIPDDLRAAPDPVIYGGSLLAPTLAAELGLALSEPPADWLPGLPDEYRRRAVRLTTAGAARRLTEPAFVKPPNDKSFPAGVYAGPGLPEYVPADAQVLVAEVVEWEAEFRCFVLARQVRTLSVYMRAGVPQADGGFVSSDAEDAEVRAFAGRLLADPRVPVPRAVALDVGKIRGRGWAAVELNAAWAAGIYGCDPAEVLEVLRHTPDPAR